jgi:hypothetical protein
MYDASALSVEQLAPVQRGLITHQDALLVCSEADVGAAYVVLSADQAESECGGKVRFAGKPGGSSRKWEKR